jgi:hypothetical protein
MKAKALAWSPLIVPLLITLPLPLIFLALSVFSGPTPIAALYLFAALVSLGIGAFISIGAVIFLLVYRQRWLKRLRDRLAKDGVTASELEWFTAELKSEERRSLRAMEKQHPLLADAYRETLASRVTATRVVETAKRELHYVERKINRATYMKKGAETQKLLEELNTDRERLKRIQTEGKQLRSDAEARLQLIEATARRSASWSDVEVAIQRLSAARDHLPLALELAKIEEEIRADVEREVLTTSSDIKQLPEPIEDNLQDFKRDEDLNEPQKVLNDSTT